MTTETTTNPEFDQAAADEYMDNQEYKRGKKVKVAYCLCGCGAQVGRRFKPGHDAVLKSELIRAHREGRVIAPEMGVFASRNPMEVAVGFGWQHFLTGAPAAPRVARESKPAPVKRVFAKVGRWSYEGEIKGDVFHYQDRQGNPLDTTHFTVC